MVAIPHEATIHDLIMAYVTVNSDESTSTFVRDDLYRAAQNIITRNTSKEIENLAKKVAKVAQHIENDTRFGYDIAVGAILAFAYQKNNDQKLSIITPDAYKTPSFKSRNPPTTSS